MAGAEERPLHVIVTRPEPAASKTVLRLKAQGIAADAIPMTEIHALPVADISDDFDAAVVTSANAVRFASARLLEKLRRLPVFAVGEATGTALRDAGFDHVTVHGPDAISLAMKLSARLPQGARIAYLCGRERKDAIERGLSAYRVVAIETYHAPVRTLAVQVMRNAVSDRKISHVLSYSRRAGTIIAEIFSAMPDQEIVFACISENAAEPLRLQGLSVSVASSPDEDALFELLGVEKRS